MGQFKRARLRGSEELFRETGGAGAGVGSGVASGGGAGAAPGPGEAVSDTVPVELSVEEIQDIVAALELARFPERQRVRPLSQEFERLRELQDRLRRLLAEQ